MRFPTADFAQVRVVAGRHLGVLPGARRTLLAALALLIAGSAATVSIPLALGGIVDGVLAANEAMVLRKALLAAGAAVAGAGLSAAGFFVLSRLTEKVIAGLREEMVGTALGLPVHQVEEAGAGDLVSRSTDDVAELSAAVTETIPVLTTSIFSISATAVAIVALQWQFLLVVAVAVPIYFFAARRYLQVAPARYAGERAAMAERARRLLESIRGRATVRAFGWEDRMRDQVRAASQDVVDRGYHARRTMMALQVWISVVELCMLVAGLLVGYVSVKAGTLTIGAVTGALLMLIRLRGPMMGLMRVLDTIQSGYASLSRIVGVVINPPQPTPPSGAPARAGHVLARDIGFSYGKGTDWAVRDVTIDMPPGTTVALVGASGAGKSTVAALIAGLRVPDEGTVTVDGVEVWRLSDSERVARLAMVSQEVYVFSGTLRDDLRLAKPSATDEELLAALERVGADWFDTFVDGLDTVVGAQGQILDPVQAQQLALARILLLDPKAIVMDEATAEAGSSGAGNLEAAALEVTRGRTALIVAHRLDQARLADQILVMESGRVAERGSHDELLHSHGRYEELWQAWQKGRGDTGAPSASDTAGGDSATE